MYTMYMEQYIGDWKKVFFHMEGMPYISINSLRVFITLKLFTGGCMYSSVAGFYCTRRQVCKCQKFVI